MAVLKFLNEKKEWEEVDVVNDGVTFIPQVADDGTLSWSNNGSMENPKPVMLDSNSVVIKDTKEQFPEEGNINLLYLERKTNNFYRWDKTSKKYILITGGGSGISISSKDGNIIDLESDGIYARIPNQIELQSVDATTPQTTSLSNQKISVTDKTTSENTVINAKGYTIQKSNLTNVALPDKITIKDAAGPSDGYYTSLTNKTFQLYDGLENRNVVSIKKDGIYYTTSNGSVDINGNHIYLRDNSHFLDIDKDKISYSSKGLAKYAYYALEGVTLQSEGKEVTISGEDVIVNGVSFNDLVARVEALESK